MSDICVYPGCSDEREPYQWGTGAVVNPDIWCRLHWGMYPHTCTEPGCDNYVQYDDEPKCFTHSPDEGSSVKGYSAYQSIKGEQ